MELEKEKATKKAKLVAQPKKPRGGTAKTKKLVKVIREKVVKRASANSQFLVAVADPRR